MWEQCAEVYVLPPPDLVNDPSRYWRRARADNHAVAVPWGLAVGGASALSGTLPSNDSGAAPAGLGGSSMLLAAVAHGSATP